MGRPKTYTEAQTKRCVEYLNFSVKENCIDENLAQALINTESWEAIYDLMDKGDYYANEYQELN